MEAGLLSNEFGDTYSIVFEMMLGRLYTNLLHIAERPSAYLLRAAHEGQNDTPVNLNPMFPHAVREDVRQEHPLVIQRKSGTVDAAQYFLGVLLTEWEVTVEESMPAKIYDAILPLSVDQHSEHYIAVVVYRFRQLEAILRTASQFFDGTFESGESEYFTEFVHREEPVLRG